MEFADTVFGERVQEASPRDKEGTGCIDKFGEKKGIKVKQLVKEGDPEREIFKTVKAENIDLIILPSHEEGHLEHFLFGRSNEEIIGKTPCSVLLVKKEPEPAKERR